ncbi:hypothetical protein ACFOLJ_22675 [Rugamonas sp. CCM 8940]|uniref:hypothetical protein n=1 Tax=Rugamonas sp. CCM 8940 TaxID=2765359 RepID=UPI0018F2E676|nr:hypothetical protein [Rugamonas sp. CCM 8940]MBJ7312545.1 hypothetical protein [Rugamonas sp. CCM 8940]
MDKPPRPEQPPSRSDTPGGAHAWRSRPGYLAIALLLAVGGVGLLWFLAMPSDSGAAAASAAAPAAASTTAAVAPVPAPAVPAAMVRPPPAAPEGDADPTRDLKSYVSRGETPSMGEVIERLHERGVHTGLGAFSPPGTRPPLVGLAVPEDFALPQGYVRHHQATDDGQRIEAILMFAPDFQLYDAAKQPIAMPADRVVPPELAPPGLPIRRIVLPTPTEPAKPGR